MPPAAPPCTLERLHTHDVEPALRFDAWRERAHQWVEMLPPPPGAALDAELLMLRGGGGCVFGTMRSSAYEMHAAARRMAHAPGMVVLTLIQSGEMLRDAAPGEDQRAGPGTLGLYDPWRMGSYRWSEGSREAFLALPRDVAQAALGREPGNLAIAPGRCTLAPALAAQLGHLALLVRQPQRIDAAEYAGLLDATRALALLMLRNLGRQGAGVDLPDARESLHAGRHAAALRFMELHAHTQGLDAGSIARGAGCSRTRLYEAFAAQGQTVMGTLRELRLQRARGLIEQSPRLHVGALAWRCGFGDPSDFSKLFRARFGLAPSQWHQRAWAAG
ncbi:MAG: helix-turn-helix transcriptional regulator [Comamonadaceae bacterium]|nr:helix-turn-helix transcriptional regulator [Comamonadaceae bacterium]